MMRLACAAAAAFAFAVCADGITETQPTAVPEDEGIVCETQPTAVPEDEGIACEPQMTVMPQSAVPAAAPTMALRLAWYDHFEASVGGLIFWIFRAARAAEARGESTAVYEAEYDALLGAWLSEEGE